MTIRRGTKWGLADRADGLRSSTEPADLVVILGNTVNPDGTLSR